MMALGLAITPSTVAAVASIPTPTIIATSEGNATVTPATVAAIAAFPGVVVIGTAITIPATVAALAAIPIPTFPSGIIVTLNEESPSKGPALSEAASRGAILEADAPSVG